MTRRTMSKSQTHSRRFSQTIVVLVVLALLAVGTAAYLRVGPRQALPGRPPAY